MEEYDLDRAPIEISKIIPIVATVGALDAPLIQGEVGGCQTEINMHHVEACEEEEIRKGDANMGGHT
jgi:hypothetical protein